MPFQRQLTDNQFYQLNYRWFLLAFKLDSSPLRQKEIAQQFARIQNFMQQLALKTSLTDQEFNIFLYSLNQLPFLNFTEQQFITLVSQFYQLPFQQLLTPQQIVQFQKQMHAISSRISAKFPVRGQISDERFAEMLNQLSRLTFFPRLGDQQFKKLMSQLVKFNPSQFTQEQLIQLGAQFNQLPLQRQLRPEQYAQIQNQLTQMSLQMQAAQQKTKRSPLKSFQKRG